MDVPSSRTTPHTRPRNNSSPGSRVGNTALVKSAVNCTLCKPTEELLHLSPSFSHRYSPQGAPVITPSDTLTDVSYCHYTTVILQVNFYECKSQIQSVSLEALLRDMRSCSTIISSVSKCSPEDNKPLCVDSQSYRNEIR